MSRHDGRLDGAVLKSIRGGAGAAKRVPTRMDDIASALNAEAAHVMQGAEATGFEGDAFGQTQKMVMRDGMMHMFAKEAEHQEQELRSALKSVDDLNRERDALRGLIDDLDNKDAQGLARYWDRARLDSSNPILSQFGHLNDVTKLTSAQTNMLKSLAGAHMSALDSHAVDDEAKLNRAILKYNLTSNVLSQINTEFGRMIDNIIEKLER